MPATAPRSGPKLKTKLKQLGAQLQRRRKTLSVSAIATAEAAGISRMTLHRIERGEPSVTFAAYLSVIAVLGLSVELIDAIFNKSNNQSSTSPLPKKIHLADYPQLKRLAWQLKNTKSLSHLETLNLYERNWRHIDLDKLSTKERELIRALMIALGRGKLLV